MIASGPVIVENNKVLLDQHGDTDFWKFCGGRTENLEDNLIDIARKKVKDELGIGIEILNETPYLMHTVKKTPEETFDVILVHYLAKRIGEIKPSSEIRQWDWLDINNLPDDLAPNILPTLKHFGFIK